MTGGTADDDARWRMALSIAGRSPTGDAEERLRQVRRKRVLLVVGLVLVVLGIALLTALLLLDPRSDPGPRDGDAAGWVEIVAGGLRLLGALLLVVYGVLFWRMLRRTEAWRSPVDVLTIRQRRELVQQVRGRLSVLPERLPLTRAQARLLLDQGTPLVLVAAIGLNVVATTLREPGPWRLVLAGVLVAVFVAAVVVRRRDAARARRFLQQHPVAEEVGS